MSFKSVIKALKDISKRRSARAYLVGGYIRDFFIAGKPGHLEMDFAVDGLSLEFAKEAADKVGGTFVALDVRRDIARVASKGEFELDFNGLKGEAIESDLKNRDFTMNAMACDIAAIEDVEDIKDFLLDPCSGRNDIKDKLVRATNASSFQDDPLRILRAFTFAAAFNFEIESNTFDLIKMSISRLNCVAGERVRNELSKIFEANDSIKYIRIMDELKLFDEILPELKYIRGAGQGPYHHLDIWGHSLETLAQLEELLRGISEDANLTAYLSGPIADIRKGVWIVKLGALLHDIGKPEAKEITESGKISFHGHETKGARLIGSIADRLRLSTKERVLLEDIVLYHLRPAQLASAKGVTKRAIFRLLRDMGNSTPAVCLVTIADKRATQGILMGKARRDSIEALCWQLMREYFIAKEAEVKPKRLLTGDDIMGLLHVPPGRIIGAILKEVEESQAEGSIRTRDEAIALAKKIYEKSK